MNFIANFALSLNRKLHVFEFMYKTYGMDWDYCTVENTNYFYVIAKTQEEAEIKAEEVARARAKKSWWPNEKYEPVFTKRVPCRQAMDKVCDLYVANNVVGLWPCRLIADNAEKNRRLSNCA